MKAKIFYTLFFLLIIIVVLFKIDRIESVNEISKMNKIEIYDKDEKLIYQASNLHEGSYQEINNIPKIVKDIFIYSEDKRFYSHSGFDIYRISKSILTGSSSGASTITQQYIKNLYFSNERSYARKIKELYLSVRLEQIYSKEMILEGYLNSLYFNHNIYGITDAARFYFNKELSSLSISQIAILANIIKNPTLFSPILNYEQAIIKKNTLIKGLYSANLITSDEMHASINEKIVITKTYQNLYNDSILYFKDVILSELKKINIKQDFNQTIKVYTYFDTSLNINLDKELKDANSPPTSSIIAVNQDGYYICTIGGSDYQTSAFNNGLRGNRQIASTVKPLLYYYAIEKGYTPMTLINGKKASFIINGNEYSFQNSSNLYENTPIPMAYALATSDNMYALKLHTALKLKGITSMLSRFNIKSERDITQCLGNVSMSLNELLEIYYSFFSLGYSTAFRAIDSVVVNKKMVFKGYSNKKKVLNENICYVMNEMMTLMFDTSLNNIRRVTGQSISQDLNKKAAGKSGLSDIDSYMIGFNPEYLIGTWVGNDSSLTNLEALLPKQLFKIAFNQLSFEDIWYDIPEDVYKKKVLMNSRTGYYRDIYFIK